MSYKVLVSDKLSEDGLKIFRDNPDIELVFKTGMEIEELYKEIADADGLVVRSATKVTPDVIDHAKKLKVIGRAGIGVDNIDVAYASKKGIIVMNTPGGNAVAAAEHAVSMMMAVARNIPQAHKSMKEGKWDKKKFMGVEVTDKILGVIGLGNIGKIVGNRALGLKMKVLAYDPFVSKEQAEKLGFTLASLEEIYKASDFITVHTPLTDETRNLLNAETFAKMKKGVRVINCARGGIINEGELVDAIDNGIVAGAAFDVFEKEPISPDSPLLGNDKVILTPHLGASTSEAQVVVAVKIANQFIDFLINGNILNALNMPSISPELYNVLKPYISLSEKLGTIAVQLVKSPIEAISIEYSGDLTEYSLTSLTSAVLKGFLTPMTEDEINFVNAPYIAKERGIAVNETKVSGKDSFESLISVQVKTEKSYHKVSGTIFGHEEPRVVNIDDFEIEAEPVGTILLIENSDKPGVIGTFATVLGNKGLNIDQMHVGRKKESDIALSMIQFSTRVPDEVIKEIEELTNIISVKQIVCRS